MPTTDQDIRLFIYRTSADHGRVPTIQGVAEALNLSHDAVRARCERLAEEHVLVLDPQTRNLRMAMPFSAVPTPHQVTIGTRSWWANCAWDALGIPAMLKAEAQISTRCPVTGEALEFRIDGGRPTPEAPPWVHFAVPAVEWWDDIGYT